MSPKVPVSRETNLNPHLPPPRAPRQNIKDVPGTHSLYDELGLGAKSLCGLLLWKLNHKSESPNPFPEHLDRDRQDQAPNTAATEEGREAGDVAVLFRI